MPNSQPELVKVAIALGSNLGNPPKIFREALEIIESTDGLEILAKSSWHRTKPIGPPQPDYLNACITCQTTLSAQDLLNKLHEIENQFGRERKEHWGARTLDLDLLLYGDRLINTPTLTVPHLRMHERTFVLYPLMEIAADWVDPQTKLTIQELGDRLKNQELTT